MATATHLIRAGLLKSFFISRATVAVNVNIEACPASPADLDALLLTHVAGHQAPETNITVSTKSTKGSYLGRFRVGSYVQGDDDLCRWFCLDLDGGSEHKRPLLDPLAVALDCIIKAQALGLTVYLEKSGGAKGWHVWGFFSQPQPVEVARLIGLGCCYTEAKLEGGGIADPLIGVGIEVFPKSFQAKETGNMVWLPWWSAAKPGGSLFYDPDSLLPLALTTFETNTPEQVSAALKAAPKITEWKAPKLTPAKAAAKAAKSADVVPLEVDEASELFKAWRIKALSLLDLEEVYSPHLVDLPTGADKPWLKCRNPFNAPDSSPSGGVSTGEAAERAAFHEFHSDTTISVFDFLVKIGKVPTLAAAFRYVARLVGVSLPERAPRPDPLAGSGDNRPQLVVTGQQLDATVDAAWQALVKAQGTQPKIFIRAGQLCHIKEIDPEQLPAIEVLTCEHLRHYLSRIIKWYKVQGEELQATYPPKEVALDMLACPRPDLLPILDTITCTPLFDASGQLCAEQGYNPSVRAWYEQRGLKLIEVSTHPSGEEVEGAKAILADVLFGEFRFASASDLTHAIGALLLPFVRNLIAGPTPLHGIEAPTEGSGKGLLITIISAVALGLDVEIGGLPEDETEIRQRLFSELSTGRPIIAFDNANSLTRKTVDSAALEGVLTSNFWADRPFHTQTIKAVKNRATWFITGVNLLFSKGIKRRRVRVRIDPRVEDPWRRPEGTFKREQPEWALEHRAELVAALITLVRHWLSRGMPKASATLGKFERWSHVVGGILEAARFEGWLAYLSDDIEAVTEEGRSDWHELCARWLKQNGGKWLTVADLNKVAEGDAFASEEPLLTQYRRGENPRGQGIMFAKELLRRRDQLFGVYLLKIAKNTHKGQLVYGLEATSPPSLDPSTTSTPQAPQGASQAFTQGGGDELPF